ncbi:MAG: 5-deoxy-glucuronate isomerase [Rhizobiaceae bacterium]|nr:5-deoxy-glucuronate isomerase [Rhizobiaceae bacterium]MCV0408408.1 5-deoxy-glucuronate isomerase [Rhizobiaceae bacterium]
MRHETRVIRAGSGRSPIVRPQQGAGLELVYFDVLVLSAGEERTLDLPGFEVHLVPFSGCMDVEIGAHHFDNVGGRASVWDGHADSIYAGSGQIIRIRALTDLELAVAGGATDGRFEPFHVPPEEVHCVEVGSSETKSRRRICHLLGQNAAGRAGNLLVSELYAEDGCWSGYPPHKHDRDRSEADNDGGERLLETDHEELYHFRYQPETGFGAQFNYKDGEEPRVELVRHGDSFLIPGGYHPTVTSPGHEEYIFTILVGRTRRGLVQHFEPAHLHLTQVIPGIQAMRDKFK